MDTVTLTFSGSDSAGSASLSAYKSSSRNSYSQSFTGSFNVCQAQANAVLADWIAAEALIAAQSAVVANPPTD